MPSCLLDQQGAGDETFLRVHDGGGRLRPVLPGMADQLAIDKYQEEDDEYRPHPNYFFHVVDG